MGYEIISRKAWGARHGSSGIKRKVGSLEKWLHHSVTVAPDVVPPFTDDYAAIRTIEDIGKSRFGSYGFPYTFAITPVGLIFEGHPIDEIGAHTQGRNTRSVGIVFVGNYESDRTTDEQIRACAWLLQEGKRKGWWGYAELDGGHRDTKATACPGKNAYNAISDINSLSRGADIDTEDDMPSAEEIAKAVWKTRLFTLNGNEARAVASASEGDTRSAGALLQRTLVLAYMARIRDIDVEVDAAEIAELIPDSLAEAVVDNLVRRLED